jgi:hypothetical protein
VTPNEINTWPYTEYIDYMRELTKALKADAEKAKVEKESTKSNSMFSQIMSKMSLGKR